MNIYSNSIVTKAVNNAKISKVANSLCKPGAFLPVILLEGTTTAGRTYQAYKRDGKVEARERLFDEVLTGVFWLWGMGALYSIGDKIAKSVKMNLKIDAGKDRIRDPFALATKGNASMRTKIAAAKFAKISIGSAIGLFIMGNLIPKFKNRITEKYKENHKDDPISKDKRHVFTGHLSQPLNIKNITLEDYLDSSKNKQKVSFKGNYANIFNIASHSLENSRICQLLTLDFGLLAGRCANSRNEYEKDEIVFRDCSSSFFYVAATPLTIAAMQLVDRFKGKNTELDPKTADFLSNKFNNDILKGQNQISVEDFKKQVLGEANDNVVGLFKDKLKDKGYITVTEFKEQVSSSDYRLKAEQISKLQPQKLIDGNWHDILTPEQVEDSCRSGMLHDFDWIKEALDSATDGKASDVTKFVSQKRIAKVRKAMNHYAECIAEQAKDGVITKEFIQQMKNRNMLVKLAQFSAGFAISAAFLSTIIPKTQNYITAKRTGKNEFPGIAKYD